MEILFLLIVGGAGCLVAATGLVSMVISRKKDKTVHLEQKITSLEKDIRYLKEQLNR